MENILENLHFLKLIYTSSKKFRNILIDNSNKKQLHSLCEIIYNTLEGNLIINYDDLKKISKHKKILRAIADKSVSLNKKKTFLKNKFSIIKFLLPKLFSLLRENDNGSHSKNDSGSIQPS